MKTANGYQHGGSHYATTIQHWDFVLANEIPYMEAQVIKYLCRWRKKNGLEDLRKAQHFLEKLIEWETGKAAREGNSYEPFRRDNGGTVYDAGTADGGGPGGDPAAVPGPGAAGGPPG